MKTYFWIILTLLISNHLNAQQLVFTHQPASQSVCEASDQMFSLQTDTVGFEGEQMVYTWLLFNTQNWMEVDPADPHFEIADSSLYVLNIPLSMDSYLFSCVITIGGYEFYSDTATLVVNPNPTVDFEYDGHCFGEKTAFINTTPDLNNFEAWHWQFGDENCSDSSLFANANHYYCAPGEYNVTLKGLDQKGCEGEIEKIIEIFDVSPPVIEGPDIACSYQENIRFFADNDYSGYRWSLEGLQLPCTLQTDSTFDVLLDCELTELPLQFDVQLEVTDQLGCKRDTMKEFLVLTYRSPENGVLIRKPENSNLLICLLDDTTNMVFNWARTLKTNPSDTLEKYNTHNNYVLFMENIDLSLYDYSVEVINTAENYCSSTFYLYPEGIYGPESGKTMFKDNPKSISIRCDQNCFLYVINNDQKIIMNKQVPNGAMEIPKAGFKSGSYKCFLVNDNMIIANTSFIVN